MVFNSLIFVLFFCLVYGMYVVLPFRAQNRLLLVASYIFYGWWDWRFLGLILLSTVIDYSCGMAMGRQTSPSYRRALLIISVASNLGILGYFKYANFFAESLRAAASTLGISIPEITTQIVLPVGISFYTFQTLSYTIDVYRGHCASVNDFGDFALFVSYFPQLVAGPIERASVLLPQLTQPRVLRPDQFEQGCWLILSGFYLKTVLADNLSPFTQRVFENPDGEVGAVVLVAIYSAAFQIYGDFAGYTNIARGISMLMGIDLMRNFARPYFAVSPSDFWRRWHISLSTWLRDYLYIPLGGNRGATWMTYRNLMLTMVLGGLWHGASWNFVVWGVFHGLILCIWRRLGDRPAGGRDSRDARLGYLDLIWVVVFFHVTCFGWVLFFVDNLSDVPTLFVNCLGNWRWNGMVGAATLLIFALPVVALEFLAERDERRGVATTWPLFFRIALYSLTLTAILLCGSIDANEFIYFQF